MGINHEGAHARVFRGLDGERRVHMLRKRDVDYNDNLHRFIHVPHHNTNHNKPKMNIPEGFSSSVSSAAAPTPTRVLDKDYHNNVKWNVPEGYEAPQPTISLANKQQVDEEDVETVYSVVYQTMSASFTGSPAGYVTETAQASPTNVAQAGAQTAASPAATSTQNSDESAYESAKAAAQGSPASSSSSATSDSPVPTRQVIPQQHSSSVAATTSAAITSAYVGAAIQNTAAPSAVKGVPLQVSATPEASNSGMSGGAKAGLAFGIIIALGLVAGLFFFCWRRRKNQNAGGEEINEKSFNEKSGFAATTAAKRMSADSDKSSVRSSNTPTTAPRLSLRPVTQFLPNLTSSNNAAHEKPSNWERRPQAAQNPFGDAAVLSEKQANPFEENANHERSISNGSASGSEDPATPKSTKFGTAAAVPVAKGPNNVHRVQLDFKPSMEDELELTSGQLVRMLHEYDDGWVSLSSSPHFFPHSLLTYLPRLSAPAWTAPNKVSSHAPASPSSPSSLAAHRKAAVPKAHPSALRHQAPTLLARSLRPASSLLASLRRLLLGSLCPARLSKPFLS